MYIQVSKSMFRDAFIRADRKENFSYDALGLLFDYLEEYEDSAGEKIEFDVIAICCDYTEDDIEDIKSAYDIPEDATDSEVISFLEENTQYIGQAGNCLVYAQF